MGVFIELVLELLSWLAFEWLVETRFGPAIKTVLLVVIVCFIVGMLYLAYTAKHPTT